MAVKSIILDIDSFASHTNDPWGDLLLTSFEVYYISFHGMTHKDAVQERITSLKLPSPDSRSVHLIISEPQPSDCYTAAVLSLLNAHLSDPLNCIGISADSGFLAALYQFGCPAIGYTDRSETALVADIRSLLKSSQEYDPFSLIVLNSQQEISCYLREVSGMCDDFLQICDVQTQDYSKWMFDLDNKAYLILIVATFCSTMLFERLAVLNGRLHPWQTVLAFSGLVFSLLAVGLAIWTFASRSTHGSEKRLGRKRFWSTPEAITFQKQANKSAFPRFAYLKYFKARYHQLDPVEVRSLSLLNLRAANYQKIQSELRAKWALIVAVILIFLLSCASLVTSFSSGPADTTPASAADSPEILLSDNSSLTIYTFSSEDFDEGISSLSSSGHSHLNQIYENLDKETPYFPILFTSPPEQTATEALVWQHKCAIMRLLIKEDLWAHGFKSTEVIGVHTDDG